MGWGDDYKIENLTKQISTLENSVKYWHDLYGKEHLKNQELERHNQHLKTQLKRVITKEEDKKMIEYVELILTDFDSMENNSAAALINKSLGIFGPTDKLTAHGNATEFISKMPAVHFYLGHDGEVYPKLEIKRGYLK